MINRVLIYNSGGGIGPTHDDITSKSIGKVFKLYL